jgi:mRNA interferase RelE/StbE
VPYRVQLLRSARDQLAALPKKIQGQIAERIDALADDPRPSGVKVLHARERIYRIRSGDYRVLYTVADEQAVVTITDIGDRKDVYRNR